MTKRLKQRRKWDFSAGSDKSKMVHENSGRGLNVFTLNYRLYFLVLIVALLAWPTEVFSTDYFVSSSSGNDARSGLTSSTAWATFRQLRERKFSPGDRIVLKRGDIWREQLRFSSSGDASKDITISAYGQGQAPRIYGSKIIVEWDNLGNGTYVHTYRGTCYSLMEDEKPLRKASSKFLLDGNWYNDNRAIYYRPTNGVIKGHVIERGSTQNCITIQNLTNITVDGLEASGANGSGISIIDSSDITIANCILRRNGMAGILVKATSHEKPVSNIFITENLVEWNADGIYLMGNGITKSEVTNNTISYSNYNLTLNHTTNDGHAIGIQNTDNSIFEGNTIHHNYTGIALWAGGKLHSNNNLFVRNFIHHNQRFGACQGGDVKNSSTNNVWAYNIIAYNGLSSLSSKNNSLGTIWSGGFRINREQNPPNFFVNNTLVGNDYNFFLYSYTDGVVIANNISATPKFEHIFIFSGLRDALTIDANAYYSSNTTSFRLSNREGLDYQEWMQLTNYRFDRGSFVKDPQFSKESPQAPEDFRLRGTSPCIDRSMSLSIIPERDYFGKVCKALPDMGACEYADRAGEAIYPPRNIRITAVDK